MTKLIAKLLDLVSLFFFPGTNIVEIGPKKSDYPDRPKDVAFSPQADAVLAQPSKMTKKPAASSITEKRDKEFWETL